MKVITKIGWNFLAFLCLILVISGFFYFESSIILRIMAVFLGLIAFFSISFSPDILPPILLYLGLYDLYNVRYGLAVPLFIIILVVFILTVFVFFLETRFNKFTEKLDKNIFLLYVVTSGLIILEVFLTMSFWPVDPKIKSLVIVVIYYLLGRIFYMYVNNMLHLKKIINYIVVSVVVLGLVLVYNMFYGH